MAPVKPSKHYPVNVKVVPHRPLRRLVIIFLLLVLLALGVVGSFYGGHYYAVGNTGLIVAERDDLRQRYADKVAETEQLSQQVTNLELASEVDRKANEAVRAEVVRLKEQLARLEEKNSFYLGLMQPEPDSKGLVIEPPAIMAAPGTNGYQPGVYRYSVVVKQISARHQQVDGYLGFELLGSQQGQPKRIALREVSETVKNDRIKLNFKYFQRIVGKIILPADFVPEGLELTLVTRLPEKVIIDKEFAWFVKEEE